MKKKLLALVCALVMIFSLASCGLSTPDTVGKVGDFEVSSGLYLLAQFSAYQQAAQLAGKDQDATDVKAFLKETITTDADSGETAVVQDYVADKTLETLRTFAAIDARFAELGGELTAEQTQVADNYAQQLMDQYGSTYTANGIGLETLKAFERIQLKHTLLLTLVYGPDGESPVDDSDLTEHLDSQMYELAYVNIPLYNTSTFVFAPDDQKAQMLQLAQAAAASCSETQDGSVSEQVSALHSAASAALPDIYAVLDSTPAEVAAMIDLARAQGIIKGYKTLVDWEKAGVNRVEAVIELNVSPKKSRGFDEIAATIAAFDEVESVLLMSGGYDLQLVIKGQTFQEIALFVAKRLSPLDDVLSTATHFVLRTYKKEGRLYQDEEIDERECTVL